MEGGSKVERKFKEEDRKAIFRRRAYAQQGNRRTRRGRII